MLASCQLLYTPKSLIRSLLYPIFFAAPKRRTTHFYPKKTPLPAPGVWSYPLHLPSHGPIARLPARPPTGPRPGDVPRLEKLGEAFAAGGPSERARGARAKGSLTIWFAGSWDFLNCLLKQVGTRKKLSSLFGEGSKLKSVALLDLFGCLLIAS